MSLKVLRTSPQPNKKPVEKKSTKTLFGTTNESSKSKNKDDELMRRVYEWFEKHHPERLDAHAKNELKRLRQIQK